MIFLLRLSSLSFIARYHVFLLVLPVTCAQPLSCAWYETIFFFFLSFDIFFCLWSYTLCVDTCFTLPVWKHALDNSIKFNQQSTNSIRPLNDSFIFLAFLVILFICSLASAALSSCEILCAQGFFQRCLRYDDLQKNLSGSGDSGVADLVFTHDFSNSMTWTSSTIAFVRKKKQKTKWICVILKKISHYSSILFTR